MRLAHLAFPLFAACAALLPPPVGALEQRETWLAAADSTLDAMRGGFGLVPGLTVSFGIMRTVEINGAVVSSTAFEVADLRSISLAQAQQLARQVDGTNFVQNGSGNTFTTTLASGVPALVVQNTLNDQKIRTLTEINAVTNGMSLLKNLNLSQSLNDAIGAATRR
jgi:hypothetical protein